ncbi:haloacid dehalogenase-like hydrolase domain-containing protein [Hibiscus syriacus]|uniref:Haloacid dehalogenase-like hydrolase domain-containing protein n=1 Tax=Hibiscus syriacus TaxID=106335 RepID=A0A6A3AYC9_HIBSY|nr:CBBY-like protein [Hibiscus syriacus]KAE8707962.1 haloacid dehalogenase-like hydrolase domain-containing protein [Hibiscus syriacus]
METASCSILYTLGFSRNTLNSTINNNHCLPPKSNICSIPSFSSTFPRNFNSHGKNLQFNDFTAFSSSSSSQNHNPSQELAVLLEVDGVLMDAYQAGNRQAFNLAFQKLGLDCANWTEPVYLDLVRRSASNEEKMLVLYFNRIGWPTSLPTSEKDSFVRSVLREKKNALEELVLKSLPLQPGVEEFIDDACNKGIPVVILTSYSKDGDKIARSIVEKLGDERLTKIKVVGNEEVEKSLYGQLVFGKGVSSSLDEQLAKEERKSALAEKQRIAEEVASMLKVSVNIDTTSSESLEKIVVALRAGAEIAEVPVCNCVLIAGSKSGLAAAEQIGMPCVVLRSSFTSRAEFPTANAIMDGFGGADLTISKLCQKRWS